MKTITTRALFCSLLLLTGSARAQDFFKHIVTSTLEDMAEIKRRAEAGDVRAQCKIANSLADQFHSADALQWYSKAARQGDLESFYQTGRMLLYGATGSPSQQTVPANPQEGIRIVFRAATNGHATACRDMYRAYKDGRGVAKDIAQAYAWLQIYVDATDGLLPSPARYELNQLALEVDVATSQEGKRLAALYKSGHWPILVVQAAPQPSPATIAKAPPSAATTPPQPVRASPPRAISDLKLSAIAQGQTPVAFINGKVLGVGETVTIPAKPRSFDLKCEKIEKDSVLVSLDGEPEIIRPGSSSSLPLALGPYQSDQRMGRRVVVVAAGALRFEKRARRLASAA